MLKYAKIINEETKEVQVGLGTNSAFYQSIGMTEMEVEQAYNGSWYVKGYAPIKPLQQLKSEKLSEIKEYFNKEQESGHTTSSLGFEVDATRRSKDDIESLLYVDEFPVRFKDYNNEFHDLSKEQVEVLKREIIAYGLAVYQKKWSLEEAIKNATTVEELEVVKWE